MCFILRSGQGHPGKLLSNLFFGEGRSVSHLTFPWLRVIFYQASILTFVLHLPPRKAHFPLDSLPVHSLTICTA